MTSRFKAIELDPATRQRTGREHVLEADNRQTAIDALLRVLEVDPSEARADPTRTIVHVGEQMWTIVTAAPAPEPERGSLRRGGAKHKHVR